MQKNASITCKTHCNKAMDDCISETLFKQMADKMFFDYELVLPSDESDDFGKRSKDGGWSGLIGDLVSGEVDIAVAAMTMTSERPTTCAATEVLLPAPTTRLLP